MTILQGRALSFQNCNLFKLSWVAWKIDNFFALKCKIKASYNWHWFWRSNYTEMGALSDIKFTCFLWKIASAKKVGIWDEHVAVPFFPLRIRLKCRLIILILTSRTAHFFLRQIQALILLHEIEMIHEKKYVRWWLYNMKLSLTTVIPITTIIIFFILLSNETTYFFGMMMAVDEMYKDEVKKWNVLCHKDNIFIF